MVSPIINNMSIPKQEYYDLKEYWDYQRKLEYNKEVLRNSIESAIVLNGEMENVELPFNHDELFEMMWAEFPLENLEDPPGGWIPKNEKYQIEGTECFNQKKY